jgi:CubicO group peptidase (beta-lactamase class C family)
MNPIRRLVCVLVLALAPVVAAATSAAGDDLSGLWKAQKWFGPDTRGPVIIRRAGAVYSADMLGRLLSVRMDKDELVFDLPDGQGTFRGKFDGKGEILGHWQRPGSPVNNGQSISPVRLRAESPDRWLGDVVSMQDKFTFYLLLAPPQVNGSMGAVLRNPEFDFGTQQGVERLTRDGSTLKLLGKRQGKQNEVGTGSYDAENKVLTLNFPGRGGNYDFRREGDDSEFYPRGKHPARYSYTPPPGRDDGWPVATLQEANIDPAAIEKFVQKLLDMPMDSTHAAQIHSLLIARHGKLVLEEYFHGEHRDKPHGTRSAAKSVTAIIAGAAMQAGAPLKLSSPVYAVMDGGTFPPDLDAQKRTMTLEHLLTMSSGFFCDDSNDAAPGNEETMQDQTDEPDYYRYTLKVPQATPPGENSVYCSASPNLALGMVGRATGEFPLYNFDRLVAAPMKIDTYVWPLDPAGNPYGGGGTAFLPRDFLKFGQLMLDGGTWQGHRILSRDFVAHAMAPLYHLRKLYYGYNWWGEDFPYKHRNVHAVMALGAGGQTVTVVPELELVIGFFSGNYSSPVVRDISHHYVPRYILPAVRERGDDKNAPVVEVEYKTPYGASTDGSRVTKTKE